MSINDMRYIINQISEIMENQELNELGGLGSSIKNGLNNFGTSTAAALGSKKAKGASKRNSLAKKMMDGWKEWLGKTGKEGNIEDLQNFLSARVGFTRNEAIELIKSSDTDNNIINSPQNREDNNDQEEGEEETPQQEAPPSDQQNADNTKETKPEQSEEKPTASVELNKDVQERIDNLNNLINYKSHGGNPKAMDFKGMQKDIKYLISSINPKIPAPDTQRLEAAESALNGISMISSNANLSDEEIYENNHIETHLRKVIGVLKDRIKKDNTQTESINEDILDSEGPLDNDFLYNFFKKAAGFAYEHNLVGKSRKKDEYSVPVDSAGGYQTPQNAGGVGGTGSGQKYKPYSDQEKDEKRFNRRMDSVWDKAETIGLDTSDIQDAKALANKNKYEDINKPEDIKALAAIGWSFLRSLR